MSFNFGRVKLLIRDGGSWRQTNEGWVYVSDHPGHRVTVRSTVSHSRLLDYVQSLCGIDFSLYITRITYIFDGQVYQLSSDETVFSFFEYAGSLNYPSIIYVCVL